MRTFIHFNALAIEEVCAFLDEHRGMAKLNAGGSDLLSLLKGDVLSNYPEVIINIKTIPGLAYIEEREKNLRIGALFSIADIARSPLLGSKYPLLVEAAQTVATPQIRSVATIGGNLCQETRCWYYRYPRSIGGPLKCIRKGSGHCLAIKGDNRYHALMGGKKCFAVCPSDMAVALAALDGKLKIVGPKGERELAVVDFYHPLGNALSDSEMIREVEIPARKTPVRQTFLKFTIRKPVDFAIVSVATIIALEKGICHEARIVLGAIAPYPIRARAAEEMLIGKPLNERIALAAAEEALKNAKPLSRNAYKIQIAKALIKKAIMGSTEQATSV